MHKICSIVRYSSSGVNILHLWRPNRRRETTITEVISYHCEKGKLNAISYPLRPTNHGADGYSKLLKVATAFTCYDLHPQTSTEPPHSSTSYNFDPTSSLIFYEQAGPLIGMTLAGAVKSAFKSTSLISWKPTGRLQQTVASCIERTGRGLHSGKKSSVRIWPELAGKGRYFELNSKLIPASIEFVKDTPLCTMICKDGYSIKTVEHLLSALEATGVDNCRIDVRSSDEKEPETDHRSVEIPIFDGSAKEWVEGIEKAGLKVTNDINGDSYETMAPFLNEPAYVWRNDSFLAAFPYSRVKITYGIDFPQVPAIGCQWFSSNAFSDTTYVQEIACSRTFCIYEEVEKMRDAGLIAGGSAENAIVCSAGRGWLNPPLRFSDEPCRHKVLDLIGDLSLLARDGSQGLPVAHIVAYKGGHTLHVDFLRHLMTAT